VEAGEFGLMSAIRELEEELGIKVKPKDVRYIGCRRTQTQKFGMNDNHFNEYFLAFKDRF
jgi:8-oxo-dGTP pyrophosphatase MutT (NUDIX family)